MRTKGLVGAAWQRKDGCSPTGIRCESQTASGNLSTIQVKYLICVSQTSFDLPPHCRVLPTPTQPPPPPPPWLPDHPPSLRSRITGSGYINGVCWRNPSLLPRLIECGDLERRIAGQELVKKKHDNTFMQTLLYYLSIIDLLNRDRLNRKVSNHCTFFILISHQLIRTYLPWL